MKTHKKQESIPLSGSMQRRNFLKYVGGSAAVTGILVACNHTDDYTAPVPPVIPPPPPPVGPTPIDLGTGDVGILNYAYALEQLEAAFYTQVITTKYDSMTSDETMLLTDIRDHEIAHREFFKKALGGAAIPGLEVDFSSINFSSRQSVLGAAKTFEDLGVSAYNGAGKLITSADYLLVAGKIVSVEARHAAYIRDLLLYGSFANDNVIDSNGLDGANAPAVVLKAASSFLKSVLDGSHLPTN